MISALVIGCGVILLLKEFLRKERIPFSWEFVSQRDVWIRILITIVLGIIYGLVLDWLGYVIATFFFMIFMATIINIGKHLQNLLIAAAFSVITFAAFALFLKLSLPRGILGDILPF